MPALTRKLQKIFANSVSNSGQFGSGVAGTKITSTDLDVLQALAAFLNGLEAGVLDIDGEITPILEEIQGLHYIATRQLAYIFERGIPEYEVGTNYFVKSIVVDPGTYDLYGSLINDNIGNVLTDNTKWEFLGSLQGLSNLSENNFVSPPTTNNSGFTDDANTNPYGIFFDDGKPLYGKPRYVHKDLRPVQEKDDFPLSIGGRQGFFAVDARNDKPIKRQAYYGGGWAVENDPSGIYVTSSVAGDFILINDIMDNLNILHKPVASAGVLSIYENGVDTTINLDPSSDAVLASQNYDANCIHNVASTFGSKDIYLIKLEKDDTNETAIYGIEIINEPNASTQEIAVPQQTKNIQGKEATIAALTGVTSLNVKEGITGTKGSFVGHYLDKDGVWQSEKQEPENYTETGVAEYNAGASDSISGLTDSSKFYDNSQGNITRIKITADNDKALLLVPSAAPDANNLTLANDFDGVADTTLFAGNKQFEPDGVTGVVIADQSAMTVELYAKIGANSDHSNEEPTQRRIGWDNILKKIVSRDRPTHFRDIGNQRSDDATSLSGTGDFTFTSDDGCFLLHGNDMQVRADGALNFGVDGGFIFLRYYGSGLSFERKDSANGGADDYEFIFDGEEIFTETVGDTNRRSFEIGSDAPVGWHTLKIMRISVATWEMGIFNFITYLPKQPVLAENFDYDFYNYVLADHVITSIPTLNLTVYNGAIDQGVISKICVREFVYNSSTGTWQYGGFGINELGGRNLFVPGGDPGEVAIEIYGSGNFRIWQETDNITDTQHIDVDGVTIDAAYTLGNTNQNGRIYDTGGAELNSLGSEGSHKVEIIRDVFANGNFKFYAIDYHSVVFTPEFWRFNPYRDYLIDGQGVADNRKFAAYDERPVQREIEIMSNVADAISINNLLFCSLAIDFNCNGSGVISAIKTASDANSFTQQVKKDNNDVIFNRDSTQASGAFVCGLFDKDFSVSRRSGISLFGHGTSYATEHGPINTTYLKVINISEDD